MSTRMRKLLLSLTRRFVQKQHEQALQNVKDAQAKDDQAGQQVKSAQGNVDQAQANVNNAQKAADDANAAVKNAENDVKNTTPEGFWCRWCSKGSNY